MNKQNKYINGRKWLGLRRVYRRIIEFRTEATRVGTSINERLVFTSKSTISTHRRYDNIATDDDKAAH